MEKQAAPSADQFRAEFSITFDDRERRGKTHTFADLVHLVRPAAEFQSVPNPYAHGAPLSAGSPTFSLASGAKAPAGYCAR